MYPVLDKQLGVTSVVTDNKGRYFNKFMIRTFGYWAIERVAETVAYEFELRNNH